MSNALEVTNLCKTYIVNKRQNNVLKNINYNVEKGDMVAVMGPSGSGKSTLMYTVSGMEVPTAGEVNFLGDNISKIGDRGLASLRLNKMGFVFQQMHMLKNLTIFDNIILPAYQAKKERHNVINDRALNLMRKLDIADIADNSITEVSGGQLQRACICRALINQPEIIFADEPTGALNRSSSGDVMDILNNINNDGVTVMLVTHDVKVAARCNRVLYIVDGNINGELMIGRYSNNTQLKDREKKLNEWLMEMGW